MRLRLSLLLVPAFWFLPVAAQDKKPEKKDPPKVTVLFPLGVPAGATTKVIVRGVKLDEAKELRFADEKVTAKILKKSKVPLPPKADLNVVGDSMLEVEVTLPEGLDATPLAFKVETPVGDTADHKLLVNGNIPVVAEKEPNNGFKQAQPVQVPHMIDGAIGQGQDVDVFRIEGTAGQKLNCEVLAARHGSALDSILTLYDADGRIVASNDDHDGSTDSRIEVVLPAAGAYYLSLQDAHDQGGAAYVYRLVIDTAK